MNFWDYCRKEIQNVYALQKAKIHGAVADQLKKRCISSSVLMSVHMSPILSFHLSDSVSISVAVCVPKRPSYFDCLT